LALYGDVASRTRARRLIEDGCVTVDGCKIERAHTEIDETVKHKLEITDLLPFVGRGGLKLEGALDAFGIDCTGCVALDIGASTGGFTDCLLQRGAVRVFAVDSGSGQLAPSLLEDARVINIENCNARYLRAEMLGGLFPLAGADILVMDVSFISQTFILPAISPLLCESGVAITLIKPQFEVGRSKVGKGGIVRDAAARRECILRVLECARTVGLYPAGLIRSPIEGGDGNVEFLAYFTKNIAQGRPDPELLRGISI
jgi:23S rRNA (cytidine1920-2'-O)/16S rRNA (cytidine1409-2'-O)-methyltransferase